MGMMDKVSNNTVFYILKVTKSIDLINSHHKEEKLVIIYIDTSCWSFHNTYINHDAVHRKLT